MKTVQRELMRLRKQKFFDENGLRMNRGSNILSKTVEVTKVDSGEKLNVTEVVHFAMHPAE